MNSIKPKIQFWILLLVLLVACNFTVTLQETVAWSDGGFSIDSNVIQYGTHDWIAEHALDLLSSNESGWLAMNRNIFLLGTEAPENANAFFENRFGYGDVQKHRNYYNGTFPRNCIDDLASVRADEEYQKALLCLSNGSYSLAAWYAGAMSHYISDMGSWPHVIANATASHADKYEELLNSAMDAYSKDPGFLDLEAATPSNPDGITLTAETAYNAALWLGIGTYSDGGGWHPVGPLPAAAMDKAFQDNWSSVADMPEMYRMRIGYEIRATVIAVADALRALTLESQAASGQMSSSLIVEPVLLAIIAAGIMAVVVAYARIRLKRR